MPNFTGQLRIILRLKLGHHQHLIALLLKPVHIEPSPLRHSLADFDAVRRIVNTRLPLVHKNIGTRFRVLPDGDPTSGPPLRSDLIQNAVIQVDFQASHKSPPSVGSYTISFHLRTTKPVNSTGEAAAMSVQVPAAFRCTVCAEAAANSLLSSPPAPVSVTATAAPPAFKAPVVTPPI